MLAAVAFVLAASVAERLPANVELPTARHGTATTQPCVVVSIVSGTIAIDGKEVESTTQIARDGYWALPKFETALKARGVHGSLLVVAEPSSPFRLVKKVIFTSNKLGYREIGFAVKSETTGEVQRLLIVWPDDRQMREAFERAVLAGSPDESPATGSMDPAIIDAVIKRHLARIQYCYERELAAKPKLGGKIVVHFRIEPDGKVSGAATKSTTMNDATVEQCINGRFMQIRFPSPKGGAVLVNYPLLFKSAK